MSFTSIGQVIIERTGMAIEDEEAIALSGMMTDTEELIDETAAARAALRDLSGEGMARKVTGLGREMDDPDEVEVPSNIEGEALQVTLVDDYRRLIVILSSLFGANVARNGYREQCTALG